MLRTLHLAVFLTFVAVITAAQAREDRPKVLEIDLRPVARNVELSILVDRRIPFLAYGLENPFRLVVDFPELDTGGIRVPTEQVKPFVGDTRLALFSPGKTRLVLELDRAFSIAGQSLRSTDSRGHRVVIVLRPSVPFKAAPPDPLVSDARRDEARRLALLPKRRPEPQEEMFDETGYRVIVLDPGHGGIDPGAVSANGVEEKEIVLEFAKALREVLEEVPNYQVVLTRETDEFIRLRQRLRIARQVGAHLFISLHADSLRKSGVRGASVYTVSSTASDREAERLAAQENKADILSDTDLSPYDDIVTTFLIDLIRRDTYNESIEFAEILANELGKVTKLVKKHRRFAGFVVLKSPETPSVLLELGYLSNPDDARDLQDAARRKVMVKAIRSAVDRYFSDSS